MFEVGDEVVFIDPQMNILRGVFVIDEVHERDGKPSYYRVSLNDPISKGSIATIAYEGYLAPSVESE